MSNRNPAALTAGMKVAIAAVGVLIVLGVVIVVVLNGSASAPGRAGASAPASASTAPATGPQPSGTATPASEIPLPTATPQAGLPPRKTPKPLISSPLPESAARSGGLVKGFPAEYIGPMDGSDVVSSSIATEATVMQVDLVAATAATADEIRAHYSTLWKSHGLHEQAASAGTVTSIGSYESMTLAVESSGTGNRYMIHAVFRTE
jgi:hypothetical protein